MKFNGHNIVNSVTGGVCICRSDYPLACKHTFGSDVLCIHITIRDRVKMFCDPGRRWLYAYAVVTTPCVLNVAASKHVLTFNLNQIANARRRPRFAQVTGTVAHAHV